MWLPLAVSKAVLRVYSYIGQHPLTLNDAILRNADVLDRHFNRLLSKLLSHCGKNIVGISGGRDIVSYEVLCVQAFLVLECFCDFCTDGRFTDTRSACYPPAVLGVRMGTRPEPNLV